MRISPASRTIGVILVVIGVVPWIVGALGHGVGGRRRYW
ncbi:DUF6131 family protein [Streptomyces mirabilis]